MPWTRSAELKADAIDAFVRAFKSKARFLVDESLGKGVGRVIRDQGWNAVFVDEVGLNGHSDEDVYAFAWREDRILLTHDLDFLDDRRFPSHRNPGIFILPGASGTGAGLEESLAAVLSTAGRFREAYRGDKVQISQDGVWTINGFIKEEGVRRKTRLRFGRNGEMWEWKD